ncbi:hypothetical protein [Paenibacillus popilliae]|uniref:Uncharacterized protein n=1 Tax=Paenibacillus popilliae ATCC 14706 TaxID=1212764 RepID=M9LQS1_PAEPP|nr:hypothetical protein [Paenibacillus popilliae]GAC43376.1 hypothetical protein PPOP_2743 [Paenibacillus popilliae ATCC 14706]
MKKTILSLTAVIAMFASVPVYASPVVDSASDVSVNESVITEPKVKLIYQSKVPENVPTVDYRPSSDLQVYRSHSVKPGEHKRIAYIKLHEGQIVTVHMSGFSATLTNGSEEFLKPKSKSKNRFIKKDGVYLVEVTLPKIPNLDVKEYSFNTIFRVQS